MRPFAVIAALALAVGGCGDPFGSNGTRVNLAVVPVFDEFAALAINVNQLRILIERANAGTFTFVAADTVDIDPATGEAQANVSVVLLSTPASLRITLTAVTDDGVVFFQGSSIVTVAAGGGTDPVAIPVVYQGPRGARVEIAPRDPLVPQGGTVTFVATVFDAADVEIDVPVTFNLVDDADTAFLEVARVTGVATAQPGVSGTARVFVLTPDSLADTTTVFIGDAIPAAAMLLTPGYATAAVGATVQLNASLVDATGGPVITPPLTWESRDGGVAGVDPTGLVSAGTEGTTRVVVSAAGFSDSIRVTVVPAGGIVVATTVAGRSFGPVTVGETVVVDVVAHMSAATGESLGSYRAALTWNENRLQYAGVAAGDFALPTFNDGNVDAGEFLFTHADPSGATGTVALARVSFVALVAGNTRPTLQVTEMSGIAPSFTVLLPNVTVVRNTVIANP